jgi:hypothetical protein
VRIQPVVDQGSVTETFDLLDSSGSVKLSMTWAWRVDFNAVDDSEGDSEQSNTPSRFFARNTESRKRNRILAQGGALAGKAGTTAVRVAETAGTTAVHVAGTAGTTAARVAGRAGTTAAHAGTTAAHVASTAAGAGVRTASRLSRLAPSKVHRSV